MENEIIENNNDLENKKAEDDKKEVIVQAAFAVDYYNPEVLELTQLQQYTKIPITEISALGSAFSSVTQALSVGGEGLYRAILPKGGHLVEAKGDIPGFRGFVRNKEGITSHAVFQEAEGVPIDLTGAFTAIAIMGIQQELKAIERMQTELIEIIERDKESQLKADMTLLCEYAENYKYYWDNEATITVNLNQTKNIKRNAKKDMLSYRKETDDILNGKMDTFLNYGATKKVNKLENRFSHYRLALYVYSFASYMEVLLSKNFNQEYMEKVQTEIKTLHDDYRELYTNCYNVIETSMESSLGKQLADGYVAANKFVGDALGKVDVLKKNKIDKIVKANGEVVEEKVDERLETVMKKFITYRNSEIDSFAKKINFINQIYNEPLDLLWDKENLYLSAKME